jgi:hypothetical protein
LKFEKFKNLTILKFDKCHIFKLGQNLKIWQYWNLTNVKFDNVKSLTILIFDKCKILKLENFKFWNLTKLKVKKFWNLTKFKNLTILKFDKC